MKNFIINNELPIYLYENVQSVHLDGQFFTINEFPEDKKNEEIYIFFENSGHDSFSHWVYESFLFLQYYESICKFFNKKIKIVSSKTPERNYKKMFFERFNISTDLICEDFPLGSNCIIFPNVTPNNSDHFNLFKMLVERFRASFSDISATKDVDFIFFPRSSSQNYINNNRFINYSGLEEKLKTLGTTISHDTINSKTINEQVALLRRGHNVILDYGSSFFVNGLLCENSKIYIVGNLRQHDSQKWLKFLMEKISENNQIIFLNSDLTNLQR